MPELLACPFCREIFQRDEAAVCRVCGVELTPLSKLPPTTDASDESWQEPVPPHMEVFPWTYGGRGRALLAGLALAGIGLFFAPWVVETAPEIRTMTGFAFAHRLGWLWSAAVAWFVMLPLVVSRRSIYKMRGARVAVAFLSAIVLTTVLVRIGNRPTPTRFVPVRFTWGWGLYASGVTALLALIAAPFFGGRIDDLPTKEQRRGDETLH